MGDFSQSFVDRDVAAEDAGAVAARVLDWLTAEAIVMATPTRCVLGSDRVGYAPGPSMEAWLDDPDEAPRVRRLAANGLEVIAQRNVYFSMLGEPEPKCPRGHTPAIEGDLIGAIDAWYEGESPATLACPECGIDFSVTDWDLEPAFALGNLGFTFWNWPILDDAPLHGEITRLLAPHRVAFISSKL